jgi:hypothetical protein
MSNDPSRMSDFDHFGQEPPARPRGMSTAVKILLILVGGSVIGMLVCCGVGYYFVSNAFNMDPVKVQQMADDIATMDVPDYWTPFMSMHLAGVRMAFFNGKSELGILVLLDAAQGRMMGREEFEREMRRNVDEKMNRPGRLEPTIELEERREQFLIRGEPVQLLVRVSEGAQTGRTYNEVSGSFDGNKNLAFVYVKVPQDEFSEDEIRQMIESIR